MTEQKIIELFQEMGRGQGLDDPLLMTIFAKLYMSPDPMSMEELAKETGYSLASISNKVKILPPVHVKRIKKPGTKKIFLYMEKDIFKVFKDAMVNKQEFVIEKVKEKMPAILDEYRKKVKNSKDKKKLEIMEGYYNQILKFEKAIAKIIKIFDELEK